MPRSVYGLVTMVVLFSAGGAQCVPKYYGPQAPRLLPDLPTLAQVTGVVNDNSARVYSYYTHGASISSPGYPRLQANIALERPRRFRLRADTALTGPEVDMGSNDELFWFWIRRSQPPTLFFARHGQFAGTASQVIPIEPEWLIEALGLTSFGAGDQHSGPHPRPGNRLEIRSTLLSGGQDRVKITVVDAIHGWVLEQHVYTPDGQRLASAIARRHRYDPTTTVSLPQEVEIQMPSAQLMLTIDVGDYRINNLMGNPQEMWAKPTYPGYVEVDLGNPSSRPSVSPPPLSPGAGPLTRLPSR